MKRGLGEAGGEGGEMQWEKAKTVQEAREEQQERRRERKVHCSTGAVGGSGRRGR